MTTPADAERTPLEALAADLAATRMRNNRVLLFNAPGFLRGTLRRDIVRRRAVYAYPPRGLLNIKEAILDLDFEVRVRDLNFLMLERIAEDDAFDPEDWLRLARDEIDDFDPAVIGMSWLTVTADVTGRDYYATDLLAELKRVDRHVVVLGGSIASDEKEFYLDSGLADFVVVGEGENKASHLFARLAGREPARPEMRGIFFKRDGAVVESRGAPDKVVPASGIVPFLNDLPIASYRKVGSLNPFSRMVGVDVPYGTILLNRGCRANCAFCGVTVFMGRGLRQHPVDAVIDEVRHLVHHHGIRHFEMLDDDFLGTPSLRDGVEGLLTEMVALRRSHGITWSAGNGLIASSLDHRMLRLMSDSGCVGFRIGIESGDLAMLKRMRKPTSIPMLRKMARRLDGYPEMFGCGNYILGLFNEETFGQMLNTVRLADELDLDWSSYTTFQVTNKERARIDNITGGKRQTADFIPTKDSASRELGVPAGVVTGPAVFDLDPAAIPDKEQVKQIWFAFNLVNNYIRNKNLRPGGNALKLARWLDAVAISYPDNAYMPLYAALANRVLGRDDEALAAHRQAAELVADSAYWRRCFDDFDLMRLIETFPRDAAETFDVVAAMAARYDPVFRSPTEDAVLAPQGH
ncbi:MAG: cobalamin-dependent protein [Alphaproteobacteria bacterium]|nr:cobalamin-dependent protein [Alphaproteobacteria bacterium]